jgi:uncharacterized protein (DUF885 family)
MYYGLRTVLIVSAVIVTGLAGSTSARDQATFERLAGEILQTLQEFYPVRATEKGIHTFDSRLTDYSSGSVTKMRDKLSDYTKELYKYRNYRFSTDADIDFKLIRAEVEMALMDLREVKYHTRAPQIYVDDAIDGVYLLLLAQHAPMEAKLDDILGRIQTVPNLFKTARQNLHTPPPLWIDLAVERLDEGQNFYQQVGGELMRQFPDRADEILRKVTQAREAMADFGVYLNDLKPGEPGSFAVGKKNFDYVLSHYYFLSFDSDSLLRMGEHLFAVADSSYRAYRAHMDENLQNGRDSVFIPASFNRQDILDYYQWEINQVRTFLTEHDIVTVPDDLAPIEVVETPPFLRSMIGGIAYQPAGPFDENQKGLFYVRPVPDDLDPIQLAARYRYVYRRGFKGSVVHEALPGHHLQMQLAGRNPSVVRKWQQNPLLVEGWALYCEEMMYKAGLYGTEDRTENPAQWLAVLGGIRYRAARIVADVKLHTGRFSYSEAVDWMADVLEAETEGARDYHRTMVRKYTTRPAYFMAYLTGKIELERLMNDYKVRAGESFSEKEFYDRLLQLGAIPPALIREAMGL